MTELAASNFIRAIVEDDLKTKKHQEIITRFPPEPNGYLHIGHAKAICLNFGLAKDFSGQCNLRFDDTNPEKESQEYVNSIEQGIKWLGFNWSNDAKYASDYFDKLYEFAEYFIKNDLAYVCDLPPDLIREYRGDFTKVGKNSPYRDPSNPHYRNREDNLALFRAMKNGEFPDGSKTLRLKIDMSSPNMNLRDPVIYRIKRAHHIRTGDRWCIYPMYDYTHCISDALEGITHSCCSLEFEDHRPLYDWVVDHLVRASLLNCHPRQIEFSRLELQYTVTSKRKLNQLVENKDVDGWDDPRMPTLLGMRRRGYTPEGIRLFIERCGVSKSPNNVDVDLLESSIREHLEQDAPRIMAVLNPLKVILTNYVDGKTSSREAPFHPQKPELGSRVCELSKEIYIELEDFQENPESGFQRLKPGSEVRLRHSYIIRCDEVIKNPDGTIKELHCAIDHETLGKNPVDRKVKGVIHWVSIHNAMLAEVRLYDRLFTEASPDKIDGQDFTSFLNPNSLKIVNGYIEPSGKSFMLENDQLRSSGNLRAIQFERLGYFIADLKNSTKDRPIFNKTVALKDTWRK